MQSVDNSEEYINTWISNEYCEKWGIWEAIREILQNQYDGITEKISKKNIKVIPVTSLPLGDKPPEKPTSFIIKNKQNNKIEGEIKYDILKKSLIVWNYGSLERGNLLLGGYKGQSENTTKNDELIGRFGEGMKLSALALVRKNKTDEKKRRIHIYTGGEAWIFCIKNDENFTINGKPRNCLFWKFNKLTGEKLEEYKDKIVVEVIGLEIEEWKNIIDKFLWFKVGLGKINTFGNKGQKIGEVLLEDFFRHKIFVKDIFISETPKNSEIDCYYGFNTDLTLDRDRNCVPNLVERNRKISEMLADIINRYNDILDNIDDIDINSHDKVEKIPCEIFNDCLAKNAQMTHYFHEYIKKSGADIIWKEWEKLNSDCQPVYPSNQYIIEKFINDNKLPKNFYKYSIKVSWEQNNVLVKASKYETIQQRFNKFVVNAPIAEIPSNYVPILDEVINKIKLIRADFNKDKIKFKKFEFDLSKEMSYYDKNNKTIYFSESLLKETPNDKIKKWILSKSLEILSVSINELVEKLNII